MKRTRPDPAPVPDDSALFRASVGPVRRMSCDRIPPAAPRRTAARTAVEAPGAPPAAWADRPETEQLESHDALWFARPGVQHRVLRKLRRGQLETGAELDLHGLTVDTARVAMAEFLHHSREAGHRCVRIIHGKGLGRRHPVLKNRVNDWLRQADGVLAFCSARPGAGGTGAVHVLLQRLRDGR